MASPVVARKSKTENTPNTIEEAEEEEGGDQKAVGQEKQFLKTSSLASLLPR